MTHLIRNETKKPKTLHEYMKHEQQHREHIAIECPVATSKKIGSDGWEFSKQKAPWERERKNEEKGTEYNTME